MTPSVAAALAERARWNKYDPLRKPTPKPKGMNVAVVFADRLVRVVADAHGVTTEDIFGHYRGREVSAARLIAMYLVREITHMSYPRMGQLFHRDHSTVIYACRRVAGHIETMPAFRDEVREMMREACAIASATPPTPGTVR